MILLPFYVDDIIKTALTEDINYIDSTADLLIPEDSISSAYFMSKADGVLCGLEVALRVFTILDPEMKIECRFKDGDKVKITEKKGKYTFTMPASKVTVTATFMDDNTMLNFFVDVKASDYFYDAVLWAAEKGIPGGTSATTFNPNGICTRAQAVTFLWRAAGSPAPKSTAMPFTDVAADSYYERAVLWAVENGITKGTSDTTFSPNMTCTRAQIVTFIYRALAE